MIYVIPDFQNPTGRSWTLERRHELIKLANEFDLVVIEDNPYDLQTSTISQRQLDAYLDTYDLEEQIGRIIQVYRNRRDTMIEALRHELPEDVTFTVPSGGLFTWLELPKQLNARDVLVRCLEQNVAFVPGGSFYPQWRA